MGILDTFKTTPKDFIQEVTSDESASQSYKWMPPTEHPEEAITVLCELDPHKPVTERTYVRGLFNHQTGVFFTCEDGPYKIIDVSRWMEIK